MNWKNYLNDFLKDGKPLNAEYARVLIKATTEKAQLNKSLRNTKYSTGHNLNETEAGLTLPKSSVTQISLRGENAIQKARNWEDIKEATGKKEPTDRDVRAFNKDIKEAKDKLQEAEQKKTDDFNEYSKDKQIPKKLPKPEPFTFEEEIDFETWCIKTKNFDIVAEKPKQTRAIYALKDENVSNLFGRLDEWKPAYKVLAKLCHPDTGGNTLAMSFLTDFKDLMGSLDGIRKVVDYEAKVKELRVEYSSPIKLA